MCEQRWKPYLHEARMLAIHSRRVRLSAILIVVVTLAIVVQAIVPAGTLIPNFGWDLAGTTILAIFLAAHLCEYVDSSLGMGYGTTLTPVLLLAGFEPLQIVPAVLLSEFVTGLAAGLLHHHEGNIDFLRDRKAQGTLLLL